MDFDYGLETITPITSTVLTIVSTGGLQPPSGTTAQRPSGVNGMIRFNTDLGVTEGFVGGNWNTVLTSTGGVVNLNGIQAATGASSINNGDNAIVWNWALTTAVKTAFAFSESAPSTGGSGSQFLLDVGTVAASTANPIRIRAQANNILTVTNVGVVTLQGADTGTGSAITIRGGNSSTAATAGANATVQGGTSGTSGTGGVVAITGGIGGTTGVGGAVNITGGAGGTVSGNAGAVLVRGGTPVDGNGGNATLQGSTGVGTNRNGGSVTVAAGFATGSGTGGAVAVTAGQNSTNGPGGTLSISAGNGAANLAAGGTLTITGGQGHPGGAVTITGGQSTSATLAGGNASLVGGPGSGTGGAPGNALIQGGVGFVGAGGSTTVQGGFGSGDGGPVFILGGTTGGSTGAGGAVSITGGAGTGTNQNGGNVTITAGAKTGSGTDGIINLVIPATGDLRINSSAGSAAQVLTSNGPGLPPTWQPTSGGVSQPNTQIVYGTGASVSSDADFVYDSTTGKFFVNTTNGVSPSVSVASPGAVGILGVSNTGGVGGSVVITAGSGSGANTGGVVTITSGTGGTTGIGGQTTIRGGFGGSTSGAGGDAWLQGGIPIAGQGGGVQVFGSAGVGTNQNGGSTIISAGAATGTASGGVINIFGGTTGSTGSGGVITIQGGQGNTTATGAAVNIRGGPGGSTSGNAGAVTIAGGVPVAGTGGAVSVSGSAGVGTNQAGGAASLVGGAATGTGVAGSVSITGGTAAGAGTGGTVTIAAGTTTGGTNGTVTIQTGGAQQGQFTALGSFVLGNAAVATSANDGFLYIVACSGTPTGNPTTFTGRVPFIADQDNDVLWTEANANAANSWRPVASQKSRHVGNWADDFIRGGITTGTLGELSWALSQSAAAGLTIQATVTDHPGILRNTTGATSGNNSRVHLNNTATGSSVMANQVADFMWIVSVPTITSIIVKVGICQDASDGAAGTYGTNAVWFEFSSAANANWRAFTRSGSTSSTALNTTVAVTAGNWYVLRAVRNGTSNWEFFVNGVSRGTIATNLPTTAVNVACTVQTATGSARSVDIDYFRMVTEVMGNRFT